MKQILASLLLAIFLRSAPVVADEVVVGVTATLSGNWAALGSETLKGVTLATEEINAAGGVLGRPLRLVVQDSDEAVSPARLLSAYRTLRAQGISLIVGPNGTPGALAIAPIVARENVVLVSPCIGVSSGFSGARRNVFNIQGGWEVATRKLADHMLAHNLTRIALLTSEHPFETVQGNVFAQHISANGAQLVERADVDPQDVDLRGVLTRIVSAKPEGIFLAVYNQLGIAAKQLRALGYTGPIYTIQIDDSRLNEAANSLEGAIFAGLSTTDAGFTQRYLDRFGKLPDYPAHYAYDAMATLALGIRTANSTEPALVSSTIQKIAFQGVSGTIRFDVAGNVLRTPQLFQVRGDTFAAIDE